MNKTPNYQLSQWEPGDQVLREDFNADNAKIDAAVKAAETKFAIGTYRGTGEYGKDHPNSLTFTFQPKLVIILPSPGNRGLLGFLPYGIERVRIISTDSYSNIDFKNWIISWKGNTVSWYLEGSSGPEAHTYQANGTGVDPYPYIAIG